MEDTYTKKIFYILLFFAAILFGFLCKTMSSVILPVIFAFMLSLVLLPVVKKMNTKFHIPWVLATVLVIILFFILFAGLSSLLGTSLRSIIAEYPKYEKKFYFIYEKLAGQLRLEFDEGKSFMENLMENLQVQQFLQNFLISLSGGLVTFGKNMFSILLMAAFLLFEMSLTKTKLRLAFQSSQTQLSNITSQIASDTVRYISIKFFVSLATGLLVYFFSLIMGLNFAIVWAFLAFIMNFIPVFGSVISVGITTLFSLIQFSDSLARPIIILLVMTTINMSIGNILEPRIEGKNLGISPFVILFSLSLFGYIWGFIGMILAVPMTVIIKIICENIEGLKAIAVLLGNGTSSKSKEAK